MGWPFVRCRGQVLLAFMTIYCNKSIVWGATEGQWGGRFEHGDTGLPESTCSCSLALWPSGCGCEDFTASCNMCLLMFCNFIWRLRCADDNAGLYLAHCRSANQTSWNDSCGWQQIVNPVLFHLWLHISWCNTAKSWAVTTLVLMASFLDSMYKPVPDCQTILDFAAARVDFIRTLKQQSNHCKQHGQCPSCHPANSVKALKA